MVARTLGRYFAPDAGKGEGEREEKLERGGM